ncbi:L-lactate permease, partial [Mycobacterium tuberculosis]|nr:L-lactate permease [Mycobacterium tuberculosis]
RLGSRELFTLTVVAAAVSIAYGSYAIFGVSMALGAFFAGMVGKESDLFRFTVKHSIIFTIMMGVLITLQAYVVPWMIPQG